MSRRRRAMSRCAGPKIFKSAGTENASDAARQSDPRQGAYIVNNSPSVVERYVADLRRYARVLAAGRGDADDLVQECLARALARPNFPADIRNVRAYLFTVLHNVHVDQVSRRTETIDTVDFDDVASALPQPAPQPAAIELRDLARALDALPEEQHRVVLLVGLEGLTYEETAQVLDLPIGTVMSRLSRGREALRRMTEGRNAFDRRAAARA
jgi:RNA polymerase sigma-70 factor (ECF subfamily)